MMKKSQQKQGRLTTNGVILEKHEMMTVNFLLAMEKDSEGDLASGVKNSVCFVQMLGLEI